MQFVQQHGSRSFFLLLYSVFQGKTQELYGGYAHLKLAYLSQAKSSLHKNNSIQLNPDPDT